MSRSSFQKSKGGADPVKYQRIVGRVGPQLSVILNLSVAIRAAIIENVAGKVRQTPVIRSRSRVTNLSVPVSASLVLSPAGRLSLCGFLRLSLFSSPPVSSPLPNLSLSFALVCFSPLRSCTVIHASRAGGRKLLQITSVEYVRCHSCRRECQKQEGKKSQIIIVIKACLGPTTTRCRKRGSAESVQVDLLRC